MRDGVTILVVTSLRLRRLRRCDAAVHTRNRRLWHDDDDDDAVTAAGNDSRRRDDYTHTDAARDTRHSRDAFNLNMNSVRVFWCFVIRTFCTHARVRRI